MTVGDAWPAKKLSWRCAIEGWMGCNWTLKQEERRKIEGIGADLSMPIRYIPEGKYAKLVVQFLPIYRELPLPSPPRPLCQRLSTGPGFWWKSACRAPAMATKGALERYPQTAMQTLLPKSLP